MKQTSEFYSKICNAANPCYFVAEAGINHNGDVNLAKKLIDVAVKSGADAVKFQTFIPDEVVSVDTPLADYQKGKNTSEDSQSKLLQGVELSYSDFKKLNALCCKKRIEFLSTPFEEKSADFLEEMDVQAFKIPSGEITNLPFLRHVGGKKKPIILSTGMSNLGEIERAINTIYDAGNTEVVILHCVSQYPAPADQMNLRAIETLRCAFDLPVGLSDHSEGQEIALAAIGLGARIIEKHFTLDKNMAGPDHKASLDPIELKKMISGIRIVECALGDGKKRLMPCENNTAKAARKSLFAKEHIRLGQIISEENVCLRRPGTGLSSEALSFVIGKQALADIPKGSMITIGQIG